MSQWISIKHAVPAPCENVIVWTGKFMYLAYFSTYSSSWMCYCECREGSYVDGEVTHWMPLPEMPKDE